MYKDREVRLEKCKEWYEKNKKHKAEKNKERYLKNRGLCYPTHSHLDLHS